MLKIQMGLTENKSRDSQSDHRPGYTILFSECTSNPE